MTTGTRLTATEPLAGQKSIWEIDPNHTLVEFAVKHMMFTTVKGRFTKVRGEIHCVDEADPTCATVAAEIDAASVDTGAADRDNHLRSADFLDVGRFPTMIFKSKSVQTAKNDELRVVGDLTIRGVTREVTLEVTYNGRGKNPYGQEVAGFTAETTLNRKEFGLNWNVALEAGGLLVGDRLNVLIEVQAVRKS